MKYMFSQSTIICLNCQWYHVMLQEVHLGGQAQLAVYRRANEAYTQTVTVRKSLGDKTAMWHVGEEF